MAKDADLLADALDAFKLCSDNDAEQQNRAAALDDLKFARLGEQWPDYAEKSRGKDRPMLTINKMPTFIRQVVNDARQNKPQIKVKPVDSKADPMTAQVMDGLIRNIEYSSNADVAYDTAAEFAVSCGFGYIRVNIDYACDDTFDKDITIDRVSNPFSVYGDPHSTAADSSDWNVTFVVDRLAKAAFNEKYKGADPVNWSAGDSAYAGLAAPWMDEETVQIAEWWKREEVEKTLLLLSNGEVIYEDGFKQAKDLFDALAVTVKSERPTRGYKVTQRIMSGAEILETNDWAGKYIPIIPVYGEEVNIEGRRYFRSLIRDAKDAQRMFNFWRTASTELVALAPKAPFIGPKGAFETDYVKWESANTTNHPYIEYDVVANAPPPQRQSFSGVPAGALQEALNASDDMKAIMGLYDASLGARSNETSGVAIQTRQREGDVSTFHFLDNLRRGIKHTGRVLLDLIPLVYNEERMVRVLGLDGQAQTVQIGPAPAPPPMMPQGAPPAPQGMQPPAVPAPAPGIDLSRVYDLTAGKYDLAVEAGPSFTTQREEFVDTVTQIIHAFPPAAAVLGGMLVKHMDFPDADQVAARLDALSGQGKGVDPQMVAKLQQTVAALQMQLKDKSAETALDGVRAQTEQFEAETKRQEAQTHQFKALADASRPPPQPRAPVP